MNPQEALYNRVGHMVFDWASRLASHEDTPEEVTNEMAHWGSLADHHPWILSVTSVGCLKDMMQHAVASETGLVVAQQSSWLIRSLGSAGRDADATATIQAAIAMLNRDADMATDILVAHQRACGPEGLLGVAFAARDTITSMLETGAWVGSSGENSVGLWKP